MPWKSLSKEPPPNNGHGESDMILCYHPPTGFRYLMRVSFANNKVVYPEWLEVQHLDPDLLMWVFAPQPTREEIETFCKEIE